MKRSITILFLLVYMLGSTQFGQLIKLPLLVQHYVKHKKTNPETNLLNFLHSHYAHNFELDEDFKDDMNLPFKTADTGTSSINIFTPAPCPGIMLHNFTSLKKTFFQKNDSFSCSQYLSAIWQPPRNC